MFIKYIIIDYLIILINNMQIVTFLFCIDPIIYESDGWGRARCLFEWGVGAYLGEGGYYRVGALFEDIWYVLVFVWYTFSDFCLFFKSKKHMQKTLWHHLFPTFVQKQKQTCLCYAKSAVWDIYKDQRK